MAYSKFGPFTNGQPPGISSGFLNGVETFLASVTSAATDSNITSDGNGNLTIPNTAHYEIAGFQVLWSPSSQDLFLNAPNSGGGHFIHFQVGGNDMVQLDSAGTLILAGGTPKINKGSVTIIDVSAGTDITINAPNAGGGHQVVFTVGGTRVAHIDANGNCVLKGTLTQSGSP